MELAIARIMIVVIGHNRPFPTTHNIIDCSQNDYAVDLKDKQIEALCGQK